MIFVARVSDGVKDKLSGLPDLVGLSRPQEVFEVEMERIIAGRRRRLVMRIIVMMFREIVDLRTAPVTAEDMPQGTGINRVES
jgi:hypothetical protein